MGQLVDGDTSMEELLIFCLSCLVDKDSVCEADHTDILHSSNAEFRHVDLVILGVRERCREELFVVLNGFCDDAELFLGVKVRQLTLAAEDLHWDDRCGIAGILSNIVDLMILTCAEAIDIGADLRGHFKVPQESICTLLSEARLGDERLCLGISHRFTSCLLNSIGDENPIFAGYDHTELKISTDARLVETGEEAMAEEGLQV